MSKVRKTGISNGRKFYILPGSVLYGCEVLRHEIIDSREWGIFRCHCGVEFKNKTHLLLKGVVKSCGCEQYTFKYAKRSDQIMAGVFCWKGMITRCYNTRNDKYADYGGRGISVCEKWRNKSNGFFNFISDMGARPSKDHTIERIDPNGNYEPNNCKWATDKEQSRNKRNTVWIEYNGEKKVLTDWATQAGINPTTLKERLKRGWTIAQAVTTKKIIGTRAGRRYNKQNHLS